MRLAVLAALAGWVGLAEPALALDKVKFGTNWLADPEAGGFFQAVADGTYAKYGLDVTIVPGGPQSNGALMLLFGRIEFFMGGDQIGDFLSAESKLPLIAVAQATPSARGSNSSMDSRTKRSGRIISTRRHSSTTGRRSSKVM
jgi:NitT/TauT family transport system substrate-binding protein